MVTGSPQQTQFVVHYSNGVWRFSTVCLVLMIFCPYVENAGPGDDTTPGGVQNTYYVVGAQVPPEGAQVPPVPAPSSLNSMGAAMEYVLFAAVTGFLAALLLGFAAAISTNPLPGWGRVLLVLLLLPVLPLTLFGFAASFEPGDGHWVWRIVHAGVFLASVTTILRLCRRRRDTASTDDPSMTN